MINEKIAFDELPNGFRVSTVRLGGTFETMVFPRDSWLDVWCERTSNYRIARRHHETACNQFKSREG
jgi:hypothetical protein